MESKLCSSVTQRHVFLSGKAPGSTETFVCYFPLNVLMCAYTVTESPDPVFSTFS